MKNINSETQKVQIKKKFINRIKYILELFTKHKNM